MIKILQYSGDKYKEVRIERKGKEAFLFKKMVRYFKKSFSC